MFEIARCFYRANKDHITIRDGDFIIAYRGDMQSIRIIRGLYGLMLYDNNISDLQIGRKTIGLPFDIKNLPEDIQDYTDEELVLILGRKYTDDYIFDVVDYDDFKKKIMLDKVKEFNSNV